MPDVNHADNHPDRPRRPWLILSLLLVVVIVTWLPRGLVLDRYVTDDEGRWHAWGANFYRALVHQDWANTYQREHPGVPVMWATTLSLAIHDPAFGVEVAVPVDEDFVEVLAARGQNALELLGTARMVLVVFILVAVAVAFLFGADLLGPWAALVGFILLALDPFHIALSRLLLMDALVSVLMLLSVLALTRCLLADSWFACIVSAIAAGLAMLTKTPAIFLGPFALLLFGLAALWQRPPVHKISRRGLVARFLIWGTITVSIYFLLWPAMWVDPIGVLSKVWGESITYATGEHVSRTFFAGQIVAGDPGPTFYPLTLLWRTTPVVLAGLLLALVFFRQVKSNPTMAATCLVLGLFALFYGALIATGQKKLDRYVLPLLPPLDLLAGVGWTATAVWIRRRARPLIGAGYVTTLAVSIPVLALLVHAGGSLAVSPYFLTYYNPLMGGSSRAPSVMMIGRGEGLELASAYLNSLPESEQMQVLVTNTDNIKYTIDGNLVGTRFAHSYAAGPPVSEMVRWADLDYAVLYVHDWQRQRLSAELAAYFAELEPEKSIWINGLEFARIYNLRDASPPDFLTVGIPGRAQWDDKIRLLSSDLVEQTVAPGATVDLTFFLQNIGNMDRNLNLRVRIVDQAGHELGRYDGWPYGSATSNWPLHEVWPDGHRFTVPVDATPGEYRVELAFYDPGSLDRLPVSGRGSLSDTIIAGYLRVDGVSPAETSDATIAEWEGLLGLTGGEVNGQNAPGRVQAAPGSTLQITLRWQAMRQSDHAYTYFLHLVDGEGRIVAQEDRQPLNGFIPTDRWLPGDRFVEEVTLDLPPGQDPAPHTLLMGIYDPESGRRLLAETGDSVPLATINGDGSDQ